MKFYWDSFIFFIFRELLSLSIVGSSSLGGPMLYLCWGLPLLIFLWYSPFLDDSCHSKLWIFGRTPPFFALLGDSIYFILISFFYYYFHVVTLLGNSQIWCSMGWPLIFYLLWSSILMLAHHLMLAHLSIYVFVFLFLFSYIFCTLGPSVLFVGCLHFEHSRSSFENDAD